MQVQSRKIRGGCPSLGLQESIGTVQPQDEVTSLPCLQLTCPICEMSARCVSAGFSTQ